jgi:septal ring-binding cell division protein DamX
VEEGSELTSFANSAEEKRANFCKILDGKPLFSAFYGMYAVTLNELKAVLKLSAQARQSGVVKKINPSKINCPGRRLPGNKGTHVANL